MYLIILCLLFPSLILHASVVDRSETRFEGVQKMLTPQQYEQFQFVDELIGKFRGHPYQLQLDSFRSELQTMDGLISSIKLIWYSSHHPFAHSSQASEFTTKVLDEVVRTIESHNNRSFLSEYPFHRKNIFLEIHFRDRVSQNIPSRPYFSVIGWNGQEFFTKHGH